MNVFTDRTKDERIIHAIRTGEDTAALNLLYKETLPKIRKYVLKNSGNTEDVNDIFQEAVIVLYRYVKEGNFEEGKDIDAFVFGVSRNLFLKGIQKNKRSQPLYDMDVPTSGEEDHLYKIIGNEKKELIRALMNELGDRCKELLTLSVFSKHSMKEIAEKMNFSTEDAAKTGNYKCKQRLMKMIKGNTSHIELLRN